MPDDSLSATSDFPRGKIKDLNRITNFSNPVFYDPRREAVNTVSTFTFVTIECVDLLSSDMPPSPVQSTTKKDLPSLKFHGLLVRRSFASFSQLNVGPAVREGRTKNESAGQKLSRISVRKKEETEK
ncbi:hypothetical protein Trydic_g20917 [Trypoxylus dichotomus]